MGKTAIIGKDDIETDFSSEIIEIELPGGTRGLQGEQGVQGETGKTPNFHIGEVKDTEIAVASITGTTDDPVLNLGLPKGRSGVWVGPSEPVDDQYNVWVDPIGTPGTIPTKTSDLTNDSNFVSDSNYVHTDNNYTTNEKDKLADIESGADVNKIETISVNGTAQTITNKNVDITVPNPDLSNYYTKSETDEAIQSAINDITDYDEEEF